MKDKVENLIYRSYYIIFMTLDEFFTTDSITRNQY